MTTQRGGRRGITRWTVLGGAFTFAGVASLAIGVFTDWMRMFNLGLACLVLAGLATGQHINAKANNRLDELWATAYDEGYDAGARSARESCKPVVVPVEFARTRSEYGRHAKTPQRKVAGVSTPPGREARH